MHSGNFGKLLKKDKYQVFFFSCPAMIPFNLGLHYWFVINKKGKISRWEILSRKNLAKKSWGHIHLNILPPTKGLKKFKFSKKYWDSKLENFIEGNKNSLAKKMMDFIEKSPKQYKYKNKFNLVFGPNSNTFIQWILDKFSESNFKLSWRAIGKNYPI